MSTPSPASSQPAATPSRRWWLAAFAAAVLGIVWGAWELRDGPVNGFAAAFDKRPLLQAKSWHYHLQNLDPDSLAQRPEDVFVIDYALDGRTALTAAQVTKMKTKPNGERRLVIAYISIGEAEEYRWYWDPAWTTETDQSKMPAWHYKRNCAWPDNHAVKFWDPAWKKLVYGGRDSFIGRIAAAGFDGVYLDRVDIYELFQKERPSARADMIRFVRELGDAGRAMKPGFLVIAQNAEDLLTDRDYRRSIDGLGKEDLLHGMNGTQVRNPVTSIQWSLDRINLLLADHKPVFAVEYLVSRDRIAEAKLELMRLGIVPTNAHRNLDGSDPTLPRFEETVTTGTPEATKARCDATNSW